MIDINLIVGGCILAIGALVLFISLTIIDNDDNK